MDIGYSTHYSKALNPTLLYRAANQAAEDLVAKAAGKRIVLVYSGMSGVSFATALSIAVETQYNVEVDMIYVRKENEASHGRKVEHSLGVFQTPSFIVFVDDFISSGATAYRCRKAVNGKWKDATYARYDGEECKTFPYHDCTITHRALSSAPDAGVVEFMEGVL
jgi:orotate phosphoribosyltransferase